MIVSKLRPMNLKFWALPAQISLWQAEATLRLPEVEGKPSHKDLERSGSENLVLRAEAPFVHPASGGRVC